MIEAYQQQLLRCYKTYLRGSISGSSFNTIVLRGEKNKPGTTVELHKTISLFQQNEKTEHRKGWTIQWEEWNSKRFGKQKWASKIVVDTEEDYIYLLKKEQEVDAFKKQVQTLLKWQPGIQSFLKESPARVLELKSVWNDIQQVVDYLLVNDVSNHYIRSIPVSVHTKFIEAYKSLITSLLKIIHPEKYNGAITNLEQLLSLNLKPHLYPIRWLDKSLSAKYMHGMEVTGVTVDWLKEISWNIHEVWLIENETNLYLIPERKNAIAIFSKGYATHKVKEIPFLQHAKLYYWGDLDEDGYKMLSSMRDFYPSITSVFMDEATLLQHANELGRQEAKYRTISLPLLTEKEQAAFNILKHHNGRLEQERIRQDYMMQQLEAL